MSLLGRLLNVAGLCLGVAALTLQFAITIPASLDAGRSLPGSVLFYFSFFTILTNVAAALVHSAALTGAPSIFATARMRGGVAVAITVVALVYIVVLARLWQPQGLFFVCDILLHYVTPALYLAWWGMAGADGKTRWRDLWLWLAYPLAYLVLVIMRAPFAGEVPYPFLDTNTRGVGAVAVSCIAMLMLFLVLSALTVLADRFLSRFRKRDPKGSGPAG